MVGTWLGAESAPEGFEQPTYTVTLVGAWVVIVR